MFLARICERGDSRFATAGTPLRQISFSRAFPRAGDPTGIAPTHTPPGRNRVGETPPSPLQESLR